MKRPLGFTILSFLFAFLAIAGIIVVGVFIMYSHYNISTIISFMYGLSAMAVAIGLWLFRPWVFHATIIFSLSMLLSLFDTQYGMNARSTLPLGWSIGYIACIGALLVLMLYYVNKKTRDVPLNNNTRKISVLITVVSVLLLSCVTILFILSVSQEAKKRDAVNAAKTGLTYLENKDLENAFKYFDLSTTIDPEFSPGYFGKAWVYSDKNELDLAIENYRKAIKLSKTPYSNYYGDLAIVLIKKGNEEEGHKMLLKALEIDSNNEKAHLMIAQSFCHRKQNEKAWEHIQKAQDLKQEIPLELLSVMKKECPNK